mmetsp:Transcript_35599/g.88600  ORF Transcript_35599/g.88600 Transcript_35599/m.88600 type:complete len:1803 (-) Transcript_35599:416-5824(-)
MVEIKVLVPPSLELLFNTLAGDFTKEQAIKENIDNSVQSTILFHHEQLCAAVSQHIKASLCQIMGAPSEEVLVLLTAEMLHVSKGLHVASAIEKRSAIDLSALCSRQLPGLGALLQAALPNALVRFWAEMVLLEQCVRERKPRGRATEPNVLLRFNLHPDARMFECFDNGRGLNKERVDTVMRLGLTGHGNEAEICRGGKSFESLGSLCTGQISAYGIGAKGGAARLCSPDNGVAMEGEFRVRSQVEGATAVVNGRQDFAKMREEVLKPGGEPWFFLEAEATQPRQDEKDIMTMTWGRRFTRIQVTGVDKSFCSKLLSGHAARRELVSFLNDAYFPFLTDGVGTPSEPATRPLQRVQLHVEFYNDPTSALGAGTRIDSFKLGSFKPRPSDQDLNLKVYPALAAAHLPTAAELLKQNGTNVTRELANADKTQISALIARWGPDLTLRLEISLPPPALPSEKALIIYFYMPAPAALLLGQQEQVVPHARGGGRAQAHRQGAHQSIRQPDSYAARRKRAGASGCLGEPASGQWQLEGRAQPVRARARQDAGADLPRCVAPGHVRALVKERKKDSAPRLSIRLFPPPPPDPETHPETHPSSFVSRWRKRDADIFVDDKAVTVRITDTNDYLITRLTYQRKPLRDGNLIRYRRNGNKTSPKFLGKVLKFLALGGLPDPGKSSIADYRIVVQCLSVSSAAGVLDGPPEKIRFDFIESLKDLNVPKKEWDKDMEKEHEKLPTSLELFGSQTGTTGRFELHGAVLGVQPSYICVAVVVSKTSRGVYWPDVLPLQLRVVEKLPAGVKRAPKVNELIPDDTPAWNKPNYPKAHFFKPPLLLPGEYVCTAWVRNDAGLWTDKLVISQAKVRFTLEAGDPENCVHVPRVQRSRTPVGKLSLGAELPELLFVCTSLHKYIVDPLVEVSAVAHYGGTSVAVTVKPGRFELCPAVPASELELPRDADLCGATTVTALHLVGFELTSGFKLLEPQPELTLSISVVLSAGTKQLGVTLKSLGPGAPHVLVAPSLGVPQLTLVLGGKTPELRFTVCDKWGNAVSECGGEPLKATCAREGVGAGEPKVSGDTILVPPCDVTADFDGTAALIVSVPTGSGPPLTHRREWHVEKRFLAFHCEGEGVEEPVSTLYWYVGTPIPDVTVRLHLPSTDGAAVGAIDEQFNWNGLLEVKDSTIAKAYTLPMTGPKCDVGSLRAPTKKQKTKTLTARLGGATASLVIVGTQGPPAKFKLELDTKKPVAGNEFKMRAILVDAGGLPYQTRPGQQFLDGCRSANGLAVLANHQLRELRVRATLHGDEPGEQLTLKSGWAPAEPAEQANTVVLACTLVLKKVGKYTISVDGVENLLLLVDEQAQSSGGADLEVLAGCPAKVRIYWDGEDDSSVRRQLKSAAQFGARAEVVDEFDNVCAMAAVKRGTFALKTADDSVTFGNSAKGESCSNLKASQGGAEVDWPKLYLRGKGCQFPILSSLVVEWKAPVDVVLEAPPLELELIASGQPHHIEVGEERYAARVGGQEVEVRARVVCDDGSFGSRSLKLFVDTGYARQAASGLFDIRPGVRWWTICCAAPETAGEHEWSVCATELSLPRLLIVVEAEPQTPAPDEDPERTQPEPDDMALEPDGPPVAAPLVRGERESARQAAARRQAGDETESESESEPDNFAPPHTRQGARGRGARRRLTGPRCRPAGGGLRRPRPIAGPLPLARADVQGDRRLSERVLMQSAHPHTSALGPARTPDLRTSVAPTVRSPAALPPSVTHARTSTCAACIRTCLHGPSRRSCPQIADARRPDHALPVYARGGQGDGG